MSTIENKKLNPEEVGNGNIEEARSAFLEMSPDLEHEIYISQPLQEKLSLITTEIKKRDKFGYLAGKGCILHGFQGTGKNVLVKHLAKELGVESILCIDKEMPPRAIAMTFNEGRKRAESGKNTFIFIDEIDGFGQKEYARFGTGMSKIVALMSELDGVNSAYNAKGIYYVFAATNFLENVDERLIRSGRLEEIVEILLPDLKARRPIISIHQKNRSTNPHTYKIHDEVVEYLARKTNGFTPADLRSVVKYSCLFAEIRRTKNSNVELEDAKKAIEAFTPSVERGLDYFTEPNVSIDKVIGRDVYKEFFGRVMKEREAKCLLYGPKGTGKTFIPEAFAYQNECNYIFVRGSELQEGIVGEGVKKIKKLFERARMAAPCVVLLDEIRGIVTARGTISHKDDETAYLNSLLSRPLPGVFLFSTTNHPLEINDTTLSRFEYKVFVDFPEEDERESYLKANLNGRLNGHSRELAAKTNDYSFRDLERVVAAMNRIESQLNAGSRIVESGENVLDYVISRYAPENKSDDTNWKAVRNYVGDSIETERFVHSIVGGKAK